MEPNLRQSDDSAGPKPEEARKTYGGRARGRRARTGSTANFGGIHLRRDKRYPFASSQRLVPDMIPPTIAADPFGAPPQETDSLRQWKEAVMLWLSWNSTYERLTARMCKPGQDQSKIESLLDEMDQLRRRAIEQSEKLFE